MHLHLVPPPGTYSTNQSVTVTGDPEVTGVIMTNDGNDPVIVKTVAATDKFLPTIYPYVQTIEDGRGRAVLDGSFPKYYNNNWTAQGSPTSFADLNGSFKFLHNAWDFILNGGTQLLIIGDKNPGDAGTSDYVVTNAGAQGFRTSFEGLATLMGITVTLKIRSDYGTILNPTLSELMEYDAIMIVSSRYYSTNNSSPTWITGTGAAAIAEARRNGRGLYICTDNGTNNGAGRYPEGFYVTANQVLAAVTNANFQGRLDISPGTTVAYNKTNYVDSPLFSGMGDSDIIGASTSDSYVNQATTPIISLPLEVPVSAGYTTLKFAVVDDQGNVEFEQYGYNIGEPPIIELCDDEGNIITEWPSTNLRSREVYFTYVPGSFTDPASGFIKVGDAVVGEFIEVASGVLNVNWLDTDFTSSSNPNVITIPDGSNPEINLELYSPVTFVYQWSFDRFVPQVPSPNISNFIQSLNRNEFASGANFMEVIKKARQQLQDPSVADGLPLSKICMNIYNAMT